MLGGGCGMMGDGMLDASGAATVKDEGPRMKGEG